MTAVPAKEAAPGLLHGASQPKEEVLEVPEVGWEL